MCYNIIYEVLALEDQEGIFLGDELYWRLTCQPRIIEGEIFGDGLCDSTREVPVDPDSICSENKCKDANENDGNVLDIEGVHTLQKFERKWGKATPCFRNDIIAHYSGENWIKAMPFAELLVKKYLS